MARDRQEVVKTKKYDHIKNPYARRDAIMKDKQNDHSEHIQTIYDKTYEKVYDTSVLD